MSSLSIHRINPANLTLLPLAGMIAVLALRQPLGIQADPPRVILMFLAATVALALAVRHPAAFLAPVLFLPELKETAVLSGMGPAANWTTLNLACALVGAGLVARWLRRTAPPEGPLQSTNPDGELANGRKTRVLRSNHEMQAVQAFLLFAAAVAVSYTYTASPHYGADKMLRFLLLGGGLFFAAPLLFASKRDLRDFTAGTVLFGMMVAVSSLRHSASGLVVAGGNPTHIGEGQVIGLAMLLLLYAPITQRRLRALVLLVCIPWLALGLVAALARGPLFSLLLILLLSCLVPALRSPLISRRQMVLATVALVGAVMLLSRFWFHGINQSRYLYKETEILSMVKGNNQAEGTAMERLELYHAAWQFWLQRPLLGWGVGGFSMAFFHQDLERYPHNLFFEVLAEEGLVGITAFLLFLMAVFRRLHDCQRETSALFPALLPCLIYLLSIAMFSNDLNSDRFIWFWCGLALTGCELARRTWKKSKQEQAAANALRRIPQPSLSLP